MFPEIDNEFQTKLYNSKLAVTVNKANDDND